MCNGELRSRATILSSTSFHAVHRRGREKEIEEAIAGSTAEQVLAALRTLSQPQRGLSIRRRRGEGEKESRINYNNKNANDRFTDRSRFK
jgi:hypothetical protein